VTAPVVIGDWGPWLGIDPDTHKRTVVAEPIWYPAGDVERAVVFQPGYRTDRQTFGRHGMEIIWLLRGPRGATQFKIFTHWEPGMGEYERGLDGPMGADLGYHALEAQYDGHEPMGECSYLHDRQCFYDGSGMAAGQLVPRFLIEGEPAVWQALAEWHDRLTVPS
jgi:hypothetical protein